jgi:hypothetical protein
MADVTIADVMQAYANDAVAYVHRRLNVTLDFSERSLEDVDRVLADYGKGDLLVPDKLSDAQREDLWVFCKMMGGYVGEVIIRNIGGQWQMNDIGDGAASVKLITTGGVEGSPPDAVWRALTEPYKAIVSYYRSLRAILGHGEETTENGIRTVRLPPLSDQPPRQRVSEERP